MGKRTVHFGSGRVSPPTDIVDVLTSSGHVPFAGRGIQLAFGRRSDGVVIHVSSASSGGFDRCVCPNPACGRPLIAKKGDVLTHHFQHAPLTSEERMAGVPPVCTGGAMTALHAYAQSLLDERRLLKVPAVEAAVDGRKRRLADERIYKFDAAKLEQKTCDIIPDVVLEKAGRNLLVEFAVTHRCDPEKIAKIEKLGVSAIEIDLREFPRHGTLDQFVDAILLEAPRVWLFNSHHARLKARIREEFENERVQEEERQVAASLRRKQHYVADFARAVGAIASEGFDKMRWSSIELSNAADEMTGGEGFFAVHPSRWKLEAIRCLEEGLHLKDFVIRLVADGWIARRWAPSKHGQQWNIEAGLMSGPHAAIESFLKLMKERHIAEYDGLRWRFARSYMTQILSREQAAHAQSRAHAQKLARVAELVSLARSAVDLGGRGEPFDLHAWQSFSDGAAPNLQVAEEGGATWEKLRSALANLVRVLAGTAAPPADTLHLPVSERLAEIQLQYEKRVRLEREEKEAAAALERERRIRIIESEFASVLSRDPQRLDKPHEKLQGRTPRHAACESDDMFDRVLVLLRRETRALDEKAAWEARLLESLEGQFRSRQEVQLFMTTRGHGLPADETPLNFVRSQTSLDLVLSRIKKRPRRR